MFYILYNELHAIIKASKVNYRFSILITLNCYNYGRNENCHGGDGMSLFEGIALVILILVIRKAMIDHSYTDIKDYIDKHKW